MTHKIWCEISGGITGYRAAYLKDRNVVITFQTREQAQKHADHLTMVSNRAIHSTADYKYTVEEST